MFTSETQLRVRYADTDQMGMEKMGVIMPVIEVQCKYLRPALYDQLLTIKVILKELPLHHKIEFHHEVFNEKMELLATAKIILYFMESKTMKRTTMPEPLLKELKPYFS